MSRKTVVPAGQVQRVVIPRSGGVRSALPAHHCVNPDRGEGGRAILRHGIVPIDSQLLAYGDGPLAVFGEVDSDCRKSIVHRPLHFRIGAGHFGLDAIEQRRESEPVRTLRDPLRGEVPSGAGRPAVVRGHPFLAKSLLVGVLPDDIGVEPVRHAHKGNGPHHPFHLVGRQFLGLDQESGQELGVDVPGLPERQSQRMVRPDLFRQHPDVAETHAELIVAGAALGVLRPHLRVAERFELLESFFEGHGRDSTRVSPDLGASQAG